MAPRQQAAHPLRLAAREEAAQLVRLVAEPRAPGEQIKVSIMRAATRLGWTYGRTEDIWRMEARRIESFEMDQLRRSVRNNQRARRARRQSR